MSPKALWAFLPIGYCMTVLIETPILLVGLSKVHPFGRKLFAGFWLTACTYPIVVLVLPLVIPTAESSVLYLVVAETFAPLAECALFWTAFGERNTMWRDFAAIVVANLASFGAGELLNVWGWFGLFG